MRQLRYFLVLGTTWELTASTLRSQLPRRSSFEPRSASTNRRAESDTPLFEGDIHPDYQSIKNAYGPEFADELVLAGLVEPEVDRGVSYLPLWEERVNDIVTIPYKLDDGFDENAERQIATALDDLAERSKVLQFVQRSGETDYIEVTGAYGTRCSSFVGRRGLAQPLTLAVPNCMTFKTVQHEFLHALGFWHEQSRSDRDDYVTINFHNIRAGLSHNFAKQTTQSLGSDYDYCSAMHYGPKDHSSNGEDTIVAPSGAPFGQALKASDNDIRQLQLLYQCSTGPRTKADSEAAPCSSECKCWEDMQGCGSDSDSCQGSLVCHKNRCRRQSGLKQCKWHNLFCWLSQLFHAILSLFNKSD